MKHLLVPGLRSLSVVYPQEVFANRTMDPENGAVEKLLICLSAFRTKASKSSETIFHVRFPNSNYNDQVMDWFWKTCWLIQKSLVFSVLYNRSSWGFYQCFARHSAMARGRATARHNEDEEDTPHGGHLGHLEWQTALGRTVEFRQHRIQTKHIWWIMMTVRVVSKEKEAKSNLWPPKTK